MLGIYLNLNVQQYFIHSWGEARGAAETELFRVFKRLGPSLLIVSAKRTTFSENSAPMFAAIVSTKSRFLSKPVC
jgi:hypothetical protein